MAYNLLEDILGYKFKNQKLLCEAISHPSLRGNRDFKGLDYERLEFLGDAVVNLVVTESLYFKFPEYEEGDLAKIESILGL
ncbi:MAG UNVERIFIED_CONTAM: hypothetical protein LVQ98_07675 [Rickettsiaceae bacterium]|jgi:dsRNA-specific ribonuclease